MSDNYNSGLVNLPSGVSLETEIDAKTILHLSATRGAGAGTSTLGTVGAGKRWRIIGAYIHDSAVNSLATANDSIQINGVDILTARPLFNGGGGAVTSSCFNFFYLPYNCGLIATAGQAVTFVQGAASQGTAGIYYQEESV